MGAFTMRFGMSSLLVAMTVLVPLCGVTALAQGPIYHVGRPASQEEIRALDLNIGPAGKELPAGRGTAQEGANIFAQKCAPCHGPDGTQDPSPANLQYRGRQYGRPLAGGKGTLASEYPIRSIGSYWPYATTIWDYINRAMPGDKPGTLSADDVYALTAFLLYRNDLIRESDLMDAQSLPKVQMPNRNGFIPRVEEIRRWRCPIGNCP